MSWYCLLSVIYITCMTNSRLYSGPQNSISSIRSSKPQHLHFPKDSAFNSRLHTADIITMPSQQDDLPDHNSHGNQQSERPRPRNEPSASSPSAPSPNLNSIANRQAFSHRMTFGQVVVSKPIDALRQLADEAESRGLHQIPAAHHLAADVLESHPEYQRQEFPVLDNELLIARGTLTTKYQAIQPYAILQSLILSSRRKSADQSILKCKQKPTLSEKEPLMLQVHVQNPKIDMSSRLFGDFRQPFPEQPSRVHPGV